MYDNGYFPYLNATISVIVNEDSNGMYPSLVTCKAVEIIAKDIGIDTEKAGLKCRDATVPLFECKTLYGKPTCTNTYRGGETKAQCDAKCGKSAVEYLMQL
jgi:hypothetical protein